MPHHSINTLIDNYTEALRDLAQLEANPGYFRIAGSATYNAIAQRVHATRAELHAAVAALKEGK